MKKSARVRRRKLFSADVASRDGARLTLALKVGAHVTCTDADGETLEQRFEPGARLWANIGDQLVLTGPTIAEAAAARVVGVRQDGGAIMVALTCGAIADGSRTVRVLPAQRLGRGAKP